jgi:hypothetical protein
VFFPSFGRFIRSFFMHNRAALPNTYPGSGTDGFS